MFARKELPECRRVIEHALMDTGLGAITVGDVSVSSEGMLSVVFRRGSHAKEVNVPVERLDDPDQARAVVREATGDLIGPTLRNDAPPDAAPEARFEDSDRKHRAGAKFD